MDSRTVGILGGGQLGRMLVEAAHKLGVKSVILDGDGSLSPAGILSALSIEGSYQSEEKINELSSICDVITAEIEHVNVAALNDLEKSGSVVRPNSMTLGLINDKLQQREHLSSRGINLSDYVIVTSVEDVYSAAEQLGFPFLLKRRKLAYDGKGNVVIKSHGEVQSAYDTLGGVELFAEKWVDFAKELAVMVVKTKSGHVHYPVVETIQKDNICHYVIAPAHISSSAYDMAVEIALKSISTFTGIGIYGVELFLLHDDTLLVNEIAPRPHNSGHYTIESCDISQFEMHLRAILDLPCPMPKMKVGAAAMVNILGKKTMEETKALLLKSLEISESNVHWYGKTQLKVGRKMAHITLTADNYNKLSEKLTTLGISLVDCPVPVLPKVGIIMGSDSDLSTMKDAAEILDQFHIKYELTIISAHRTPSRMYSYAQTACDRGLEVIIAGAGGAAHLPGMVASLTTLPVIGVPIKTSTFNGNDSLLSIVQMPVGVPVATVAIGNASNAALLALRILSTKDKDIRKQLDDYMMKQEEIVMRKATKLESAGYKQYLSNMN